MDQFEDYLFRNVRAERVKFGLEYSFQISPTWNNTKKSFIVNIQGRHNFPITGGLRKNWGWNIKNDVTFNVFRDKISEKIGEFLEKLVWGRPPVPPCSDAPNIEEKKP